MGKASSTKKTLKEKKKALAEKNAKVLFELKIEALDNNDVKISGPINDPLLVMSLLSAAMRTVVDYNQSLEKQNADIEKSRKLNEQTRILGLDGQPVGQDKKIVLQ